MTRPRKEGQKETQRFFGKNQITFAESSFLPLSLAGRDPVGRQKAPGPSEGPSPFLALDPVQGLLRQVSARDLPKGNERSCKREKVDALIRFQV